MAGLIDIGAWLSNIGGPPESPLCTPVEANQPGDAKSAPQTVALLAPHSHAADALASAISTGAAAGSKPSCRKPHGKILSPHGRDTFDVDALRPDGDPQPQLQVQPITVVKSDYKQQFMTQIAVNSIYICYGLKQGSIRVLNKNTAARTLIKEHKSMVTDMRFSSMSSNVLASCDMNGEVIVTKIFEEGEGVAGEPPVIQHEVLVRHCLNPLPSASRRLAWHPQLDSILAVAAKDRVFLVNVPPTSGVASSPEFTSPAAPSGPSTEGSITSLAFCDRGDMLAVSDDKGYVYVWGLGQEILDKWAAGGTALDALPSEPDIKFHAFELGDSASALDFLPTKEKLPQQAVLVVGDATSRILKLWSVDIESKPQCSYTLELTSSKGGPSSFFNHLVVQPAFGVVVLANTAGKQVYVLHAKQDDAGGASLDYLSDFSVTQPILSMTTTNEPSTEDGSDVFQIFTVQTEGIQQYTLFAEVCLPSVLEADEAEGAPLEGGGSGSPPLMKPADVLQHAIKGGSLHGGSETASDAASPYTPSQELPAAQPPKDSGELTGHPLREEASVSSYTASGHGSSGSPFDGNRQVASSIPVKEVKKAAARTTAAEASKGPSSSQMPPQPTLLVKKLSAAGSGSNQLSLVPEPPSRPAEVPAASAVELEGDAAIDGEEGVSETESAATAAMAAAFAASTGAGDGLTGGGGSSADLVRALALQQQLLAQLMSSQRETVKMFRQELTRSAKASEAATAKAVELAVKAQAKQAEQDRLREAKKEREESSKALQQALGAAVKDISAKVSEASRSTISSVTTAIAASVARAVGESLPAALSSGATQQVLEKALGAQLRASLPKAMSDAFATTVVPSFEQASRVMFGQIETTFSSGLSGHLAASRAASDGINASLAEAASHVKEAAKQLAASAATARSAPAGGSRGVKVAELEARRDPKLVIAGHLAKKDYEAAFLESLNTGSPETTMWLCKQLPPDAVFDIEPCPLSQEVILSLVTHLAHQLPSHETELKLSWLVQAAPAIDPKHPRVAEHCRQVLEPVKHQLAGLSRSLSGEPARQAKTAVHLVNSLLHQ